MRVVRKKNRGPGRRRESASDQEVLGVGLPAGLPLELCVHVFETDGIEREDVGEGFEVSKRK